jgi:cell division septal protein FtsQ
VLLTVAILGLPGGVYAWGRNSSSFTIRHVDATGMRMTPPRRVERLLRRDYLSRNLFTVTEKDVRRTLASLPYVATVSVDRDFPDTLRVRVVEHRPSAYALADGRWYVIADDGFVVCEIEAAGRVNDAATPAPAASVAATAEPSAAGARQSAEGAALGAGPPGAKLRLPRLAIATPVAIGSRLDDAGARVALRVITALPRALRVRLAVIRVAARGVVTLRFEEGLAVAWGDGSRPLAKALALRAVLAKYESAGTRCVSLDVSIPDRVLARPILR